MPRRRSPADWQLHMSAAPAIGGCHACADDIKRLLYVQANDGSNDACMT
jgi:hypothetical protein